jgi:hypothetical protein
VDPVDVASCGGDVVRVEEEHRAEALVLAVKMRRDHPAAWAGYRCAAGQ